MITVKKIDHEEVIADIEFFSSSNRVLRRVWFRPNGRVFLDVLYEYDSNGKNLSAIYLDDQYNVIGTCEYLYNMDDQSSLLSRIERDGKGSILNSYVYKYKDGYAYKVDVYNHDVLVGYGIFEYPNGVNADADDIQTVWYDKSGQVSEVPFQLDTIWDRAN